MTGLNALNFSARREHMEIGKVYSLYGHTLPGAVGEEVGKSKDIMQGLLVRVPLPSVYVYRDSNWRDTFYVAEWLRVVLLVMADELVLTEPSSFGWMNDFFMQPYSEWGRTMQRRVEETDFTATVVQQYKKDSLDAVHLLESIVHGYKEFYHD